MIRNITLFEGSDLMELTGLSHEALWDAGFILDDISFGFISDVPFREGDSWSEAPIAGYECLLMEYAARGCQKVNHVEYAGKHWYTYHH